MKKKIEVAKSQETCVIYARVSSKKQLQGYSLDSQEKACRAYAAKQGWQVLKVFREAGMSAKVSDREALGRLREYVSQIPRKVSYVLVAKIDRLSRNQADYFLLKQFFLSHGVELKSATEAIEDTPQGKFIELITVTLAQYNAAAHSARTIEGIRAKKEWLKNKGSKQLVV